MQFLHYQIENGSYPSDVRLPSVRKLSKEFNVSITTAQRALSELESIGIIRAVSRSGFYVNPQNSHMYNFWSTFSGLKIQVNEDIVQMLSTMAELETSAISSAVLGRDMIPNALLRRCLVSIGKKSECNTAEYLPPPGHLSLRRQIAQLMADRGVSCAADDIIITSGDSVAMELALWSVGEPGDLVIIEEPTYFGILVAIELAGFRAVPIATDTETGIKLEKVEAVLAQRKVAAIFLNPTIQNPLGHTIPAANRKKLVYLAEKHDVTIIEDDVFADLHPEENRPPAIKHYDQSSSIIYCSSFSKVVSPGYRVGWCVPGKHYSKIMARMMERTLSVSSLPQQVLAEFIRRGYYGPHTTWLREQFIHCAKLITRIVQDYFPVGTTVSSPAGGFIYWINLSEEIDYQEFLLIAKEQGIFLPKSSVFYADGRQVPSIRICFPSSIDKQILADLVLLGQLAQFFIQNR